jgi:CRP-like cAMP-binding protein
MPERHFQAGDIVFQPGDPADEAYLILSGSVEILAPSGDRSVRFALLGPGDIFGEMSLIEERARFLTARVSSPCRATTLSRSECEHFLLHNPEQCRRYLQSLFGRLRDSSARLEGTEAPAPQAAVVAPITLRPLTLRAAQSMPEKTLSIAAYPFRIGRMEERPDARSAQGNHLAVADTIPYNVSRNHAAIDSTRDGSLVVLDRGSHLGTIVNEQRIGGDSPALQAKLLPGDNLLVLGSRNSPFQFRIIVGAAD